MASPNNVPFLPGLAFRDVTKTHFGRKSGAVVQNAVTPVSDEELAQLASQTSQMSYTTTNRAASKGTEELASMRSTGPQFVAAHVVFDKKVLRFDGYFKQTVHESQLEHYRVRYVKIFYYLEDDTISVLEPEVPNSGLPQGKLIRRQVLPKDNTGNPWTWKHLNVRENVTFYGKTFHITSCDKFTRDFLESNGILVEDDEDDVPEDPHTESRKVVEQPITSYQTPNDFDKLRQFCSLDRKVLRFYAVWDDRDNMYGGVRKLVLHFYLVDDTVEVREQHAPNNGRDQASIFIRRGKVPRNHLDIPPDFPTITLEKSKEEQPDTLGPEDFAIGHTVYVFGRPLLLYDADEFTKEFYRRNFGVEEFTPLNVDEDAPVLAKASLPPPTGYGSHEDSIQSVLSLQPKPHKQDMVKLLEHDNKCLRFLAYMDTQNYSDKDRKFIISYRLANDKISIMEPKSRNTAGGKFLEFCRVTTPDSIPSDPKYYVSTDLYIGARLHVFGRVFVINDADEYVKKYIEERADRYPAEAFAQT